MKFSFVRPWLVATLTLLANGLLTHCAPTDGPPGPSGPMGKAGAAGAAGQAGGQGPAGSPGQEGAVGASGPAGLNGAAGEAGPSGPSGPSGPLEAVGASGVVVGPSGPQGAPGPSGPRGPSGPPGDVGPSGAQGVAGPSGPQGTAGSSGPAGSSGAQGASGPSGPAGVTPTGVSTDTPSTLVARDPNGSFAAFTLNLDGNLNFTDPNSLTPTGVIMMNGVSFLNASGTNNTGVGASTLLPFAAPGSGTDNVVIGANAGSNLSGSESQDIIIGSGNGGNSGESSTIRIGVENTQQACIIAGIYNQGVSGSSGTMVFVDSTGRLGTNPSSRRFKQDIRDINDDNRALLMSLRPVAFKYKKEFDATQAQQYGLIAEEVEKVDRNFVTYSASGKVDGVRYQLLDPLLLAEVQKQHQRSLEQQAEIEALKKQVNELMKVVRNHQK